MDFLKRIFSKKNPPKITVHRGIPQELQGMLEQMNGGRHMAKDPIFMLKDHPEVNQLLDQMGQRAQFLEKQLQQMQDEHNKFAKGHWKAIEQYMQGAGLWPNGLKIDVEICLEVRDGVMYYHPH